MTRNVKLVGLLILGHLVFTSTNPGVPKVKIILDTDIGEYPDDIGAIALLHTLADRGLVEYKAIVASNVYEGIIPLLDACNHYFHRPNIPLGISRDPNAPLTTDNLKWARRVVAEFAHPKYENNSQAEDAVVVLRRILSQAEDKSITIVPIGTLTNMANLLATPGDAISSLTGVELITKKVKNVVAMGGRFPSGFEWNIGNDLRAAKIFLHQWPPMPVVFSGFELSANKMLCGMRLLNDTELVHSPVKMSVELTVDIPDHLDGCFDHIAAYVAAKGYDQFYRPIRGSMELFENGTDLWHPNNDSQMFYLQEKGEQFNKILQEEIEELMAR